MSDNVLGKPMAYFDADIERWDHTAQRRRMLEGRWKRDLEQRVLKEMGPTRRDAWGEVDISRNPFRTVALQLSALYDQPGIVIHENEAAAVEMAAALGDAGFWQIMQRAQRDCLGMREILVVPHVVKESDKDNAPKELLFRVVSPDMVCARAHVEHPDEPIWLAEASTRDGVWGWDIWDISGPEPARWREDDQRREISGTRQSGDSYPHRYGDGTPFIPHVLYHATRTGRLWDPFEARELVDGTLNVGVLWTFFGHCVRNASWPQRWTINATPSGGSTEGSGSSARTAVTADPGNVVQLVPVDEGVQPSAGQWQTSSDPAKLQEAIGAYEASLSAGVPGLEVTRSSGDPRSGYALAVSRESQRAAQRKYAPSFARGDRAIMRRVAAMLRTRFNVQLPDSGYDLRYASLPPSPDERAEDRAEIQAGIARGTLSPVDVYVREHPGTTREVAIAELRRIAAERAVIQSAPLPAELLALVTQAEAGSVDSSQLPGLLRQIAARMVAAPITIPAPSAA